MDTIKGGCDNVDEFRSCLTVSGYGQFKICVGTAIAAETCLVVRAECNGPSGCMAGSGSPGDRCKVTFAGEACALNGMWCGEEEFGAFGFDLPYVDY